MPSHAPPWSIARRHPAPRPALNAIPPAEPGTADAAATERRARHLRLCQELIERGMRLARAASDRAMDDIAAPPPVAAIPGSSAAVIAQAQDIIRQRAPDYGRLFTHLSRAVRQTMLLEAAIAEGDIPNLHAPAIQPNPARIAGAAHPSATRPSTTRPDTPRRDTLERLDCLLHATLDHDLCLDDQLVAISQQFGLGRRPAHSATQAPPHPPGTLPPGPPLRRRW